MITRSGEAAAAHRSHEVPRSKADLDLARSFFVMSETLTIGFVNEPFLFRNQRAIKYVRHSVRMRHSCVVASYFWSNILRNSGNSKTRNLVLIDDECERTDVMTAFG